MVSRAASLSINNRGSREVTEVNLRLQEAKY
jgi:hypothetical protein